MFLRAIQFNADPGSATQTRFARMAFKLRWNRWNGSRTVQLVVENVAVGIAAEAPHRSRFPQPNWLPVTGIF